MKSLLMTSTNSKTYEHNSFTVALVFICILLAFLYAVSMIFAMSNKRSSQTTTNVNSSTMLHLIIPMTPPSCPGAQAGIHTIWSIRLYRINPPTSNLYIVLSDASCSITPVMAFHQRLTNYKTVPTQYYGFPPRRHVVQTVCNFHLPWAPCVHLWGLRLWGPRAHSRTFEASCIPSVDPANSTSRMGRH